jgi:hypothetical protein
MVSMAKPAATGCAQSNDYRVAKTLYADAVDAIASGQLLKARDDLDRGIKRLGYSYLTASRKYAVLDDTGLHLSLAYYYHLHGHLLGEVKVMTEVLASRLGMYRWGHNCPRQD